MGMWVAILPPLVLLLAGAAGDGPHPQLNVLSHGTFPAVGNHPPIWTPNTPEACLSSTPSPAGVPGTGGRDTGLLPDECVGVANPPDYCRGWGGGSCQPHNCHVYVMEDSGELAPHGQRWACEVSDCNADPQSNRATQTLTWGFGLMTIEHPMYGHEQEVDSYQDECKRLRIDPPVSCPCQDDWDPSKFWEQEPYAFFREGDSCDQPLNNPQCPGGARTGIGGTGTLQFTPAPDRWGSFYYSVTLRDDGLALPVLPQTDCLATCSPPPGLCNIARECRTCKFTVLPVNDCPVWQHRGDVTIDEDTDTCRGVAGMACAEGWARGIGAGGWFEWPYQTVSFKCTTDNNELFEAGYEPQINSVRNLTADGCVRNCRGDYCQSRDLRFKLRKDMCGTAQVTCTPYDNGGTANGGCDQGPTADFKIHVRCINDPPTFVPSTLQVDVDEDTCNTNGDESQMCHNGQWCYENWASDIKVGPENEQGVGVWCSGPACHAKQTYSFHPTVPAGDERYFEDLPTVDQSGKLCFKLAQHYNTDRRGPIPITVTLRDSEGAENSAVLELTINPVNDVPSFAIGKGVVVNEDANLANAPQATAICIGHVAGSCADFNEKPKEGERFVIALSDTDLFAPGGEPTISASGALSFRPRPHASGTVSLEVRLCDDGNPCPGTGCPGVGQGECSGTAACPATQRCNDPNTATPGDWECVCTGNTVGWRRGGAAKCLPAKCSPPQKLVITVLPVNDAPVFRHSGNIEVDEDCGDLRPPSPGGSCVNGVYAHPSWVLEMSVGVPNDEQLGSATVAQQHLTRVELVVTDRPELFAPGGHPKLQGNELSFKPAKDATGTATVRYTVQDDGGTSNGGTDTTEGTFTITLRPVDDLPVVTPKGDYFADEDACNTGCSVGGWVTFQAEQPLSPPACSSSGPTGVFVSGPTVTTTGTLTFQTEPNAFGEVLVSCTVQDVRGVRSATPLEFRVVVSPVNDPPTFDLEADPLGLAFCTSAEAVGGRCSRTQPAAKNISPGPGNEAGQGLRFEVAVPGDAKDLFVETPRVTPQGTLEALLAEGADEGGRSATLTLTLVDDAGGRTSRPLRLVFAPYNEPPSYLPGGDVVVAEDEAKTFRRWATQISSDVVEAVCTIDTPELLDSFTLDVRTGDLTVTPAKDRFGESTARCRVSDKQPVRCCHDEVFLVRVRGVNDPPTMSIAWDVVSVEGAGRHTNTTFVRDSHPGPYEEGQAVWFETEVIEGQGTAEVLRNGSLLVTAHSSLAVRVRARDEAGGVGAWIPFQVLVLPQKLPPDFTPSASTLQCFEDAEGLVVKNWALDIAHGGSFSTSITSSPSPIAGVQVDINGDLSYTTVPNANGWANVSVTLHGEGGAKTVNLSIEVLPVNDAPHFAPNTTLVVAREDAGLVVHPMWALGITAGPPDEEAVQSMRWELAFTRPAPGLFASVPSLTMDGTLSFTLTPDTHGVASLQACLVDNGGVLHGGRDRHCEAFDISVLEVNDAPTFLTGHNITVLQTAGKVVVPHWLRVTPGPTEERGNESITALTAETDPTGLFLTAPSVDLEGTLRFTTSADKAGNATVRVTATDSRGATHAEHYRITVLPVDTVASFTLRKARVDVDEDTPPHSIPVLNVSPVGREVVVAVEDGGHLFLSPPRITPDGRLEFELAKDRHGMASLAVSLGLQTEGLAVVVHPVNDPPSFTLLRTVVNLPEDSPPVSLASFARDISPGPFESDDLSFTCESPTLAVSLTPQGTLTITPSPHHHGGVDVPCTLVDSLGARSPPQVLRVEIQPVNDPPELEVEEELSILEDAGTKAVAGYLRRVSAGSGEEMESVSVDVKVLHGPLGSAMLDVASRELVLTTKTDQVGEALLRVVATDGLSATTQRTTRVVVRPVNDPPTYRRGPNITVDEDSGRHVALWAQAVSPGGGPDEARQRVDFRVTQEPGTASLFSETPSIDTSGTLTFTPKNDAFGVALVTVEAVDNGGRENGGVDRSPPEVLAITVIPVNDPPTFTAAVTTVMATEYHFIHREWADNISGGAGENDTVSFVVSTQSTGAFRSPPAVNMGGDLEGAFDATWEGGAVTVTVEAVDSHGLSGSKVTVSIVPPSTRTTTFKGWLPPGVSVAQFVAAASADANTSALRVVSQSDEGNGWTVVTFRFAGTTAQESAELQRRLLEARNGEVQKLHVQYVTPVAPTPYAADPPVSSDTPSPSTQAPSSGSQGIPWWLILLAAVAFAILLATAAGLFIRSRRKRRTEADKPSEDAPSSSGRPHSPVHLLPHHDAPPNPINSTFESAYPAYPPQPQGQV